jgi:hypothetical protein
MLLAAALCLKVLLPAGYMPAPAASEHIAALCSSGTSGTETVTVRIPYKSGQDGSGSAENTCAFAPLAAVALDPELPAVVLAAILFVFIAAILRQPLALPATSAGVRPPGRGPPALT